MAEEQVAAEQETPRSSKNGRWLGLLFAFICINVSVAMFVVVILRKDCPDCKQFSPIPLPLLIILATLLLSLGVSILTPLLRRTRSLTQTPREVVVSSIPAGDLEKSLAPILPYYHVPHGADGEPFVENSSIDLPDYFTAIRNIGEVNLSVDAEVWTEIRPPCYEQALEMAATFDSTASKVEPI